MDFQQSYQYANSQRQPQNVFYPHPNLSNYSMYQKPTEQRNRSGTAMTFHHAPIPSNLNPNVNNTNPFHNPRSQRVYRIPLNNESSHQKSFSRPNRDELGLEYTNPNKQQQTQFYRAYSHSNINFSSNSVKDHIVDNRSLGQKFHSSASPDKPKNVQPSYAHHLQQQVKIGPTSENNAKKSSPKKQSLPKTDSFKLTLDFNPPEKKPLATEKQKESPVKSSDLETSFGSFTDDVFSTIAESGRKKESKQRPRRYSNSSSHVLNIGHSVPVNHNLSKPNYSLKMNASVPHINYTQANSYHLPMPKTIQRTPANYIPPQSQFRSDTGNKNMLNTQFPKYQANSFDTMIYSSSEDQRINSSSSSVATIAVDNMSYPQKFDTMDVNMRKRLQTHNALPNLRQVYY
ncbi:hypothetical protein BB558_005237 [Smittium angustum]|uniref:Uncharacterized protein n=1 Tax=Smittium angustum TaxID=133377 RepID=A0A2U1J104_SMIAN|nr:hypothetical protein BB558_005237 [Smittium angustum]